MQHHSGDSEVDGLIDTRVCVAGSSGVVAIPHPEPFEGPVGEGVGDIGQAVVEEVDVPLDVEHRY